MTQAIDCPRGAQIFRTGAVTLAAAPPEDAKGTEARRQFSMVVNTGKVMLGHPWWGNFAVDLDGVEDPTKRLPVLLQHDPDRRVGFADKDALERSDRGLEVHGQMLKTSPHALSIQEDFADGFPFQASPRLEPTVIEEVLAGEEVEVNGEKLAGPGHVFRKSRILEYSFVAVGQDDDTETQLLANAGTPAVARLQPARETMAEKQPDAGTPATATPATPPATPPVVPPTELAATDQVDAERKRTATILEAASPAQIELAQKLIADGTDTVAALLALSKDLRTRHEGVVAALETDGSPPLAAGNADTPPAKEPEVFGPPDNTALRKEWDDNTVALSGEFGDFETYKHYRLAMAGGRVRIIQGKG